MLNRAIRLCLLVLLILLNSCVSKEKQELRQIRISYTNFSKRNIGASDYYRVSGYVNDSIVVWIGNKLNLYQYFDEDLVYQIDSLICFNSSGNKLITAIMLQNKQAGAVQDDIWIFNGVNINSQWYFFDGPSITLPREYYQKDIHTPLSFEKMKEIAMKNIYSGYLKRDETGQWIIDDEFFSDLTSKAWCSDCATQAQWDSAYISVVKRNWEKK